MEYAQLLLNKVIENNDVKALSRYNITESDMPSDVDRAAYRFITDYAERNRGEAPSYATVVSEVDGFDYVPEVTDRYEYLAEKIKNHTAMRAVADWFSSGEFERKLNELGGHEFINDWLPKQVEAVQARAKVRDKVGTDIKTDADKFLAEYERRKRGESFRVWKSKFSSIGEYVSSNVYTVYGKSGRGKSVITLEEAIYAAKQGANVLIWAMEMGWFEVLVRIYVSISGEEGVTSTHTHGLDLNAGFDSSELRNGNLSEEFETAFKFFIDTMNDRLEGNITVRAVDDEDFDNRTLKALEADIETVKADFVVIDPFYYLHYEKNTSRTAGGDAANTSMKLRHLAGRTRVVVIAITQAEETSSEEDEDGTRELKLPDREDVKKTKQLLEDAYKLIAVDTDYKQGRGLVGVNKGRDGGEGNVSEILYIPNIGVVREMDTGDSVAGQFDF